MSQGPPYEGTGDATRDLAEILYDVGSDPIIGMVLAEYNPERGLNE